MFEIYIIKSFVTVLHSISSLIWNFPSINNNKKTIIKYIPNNIHIPIDSTEKTEYKYIIYSFYYDKINKSNAGWSQHFQPLETIFFLSWITVLFPDLPLSTFKVTKNSKFSIKQVHLEVKKKTKK